MSGSPQVDWEQFEGHIIDGQFPLIRLLHANSSAVFETKYSGARAAIKLTPARMDPDALARWKASSALTHRHLLKIFAGGESELPSVTVHYVVMELADDDLSLLLRERTLTSQEALEMLVPVASALEYLHGRGFALGGLKPSAIMAVGDLVKLPLDRAVEGGDQNDDCFAVGMLVQEALPQPLAEPFREIAEGCLASPRARWTAAKIVTHLKSGNKPAPASKSPSLVVIASALVLSLVLVALWKQRPTEKPSVAPVVTRNPEAPSPPARAAAPPSATGATPEVIRRVLPDIPPRARNTIQGTVVINVRIRVDSEGNVTSAAPAPPVASKYLTNRVLNAAREWKFAANGRPAGAPQEWMLRFRLLRADTVVSVSAVP